MRARLREEHNLMVGLGKLWSFLDARGLTYKQDTPRYGAAPPGCEGGARGLVRGPARFLFLNETWTSTKIACLHARYPRGQQLRSPVPNGHRKTTTFVAGLRLSGMSAPFVLDGPINCDAFQAYVERVLAPELTAGNIVVIDNLGSHIGPAVRSTIEAAGAQLLSLPPYSPDFNPIEMVLSKLKALLRKFAARTGKELWAAVGRLFDSVTPDECTNFETAAGYERI